jgi:two-component SAPR family response regulator
MNMLLSRIRGIEFIKKVKEQEAYANIPLVIVTTRGKSYEEDAQALASGNLVKPFTSNELHSVVEKLFPEALSA